MHSELTKNVGKIVAWTLIGPVAGGRCGQFLQKLGLEQEGILTATTAHTTVFAAAGHSKPVQAQHSCRPMVVAACKLSGTDEETALKALAEMHGGVLVTHTLVTQQHTCEMVRNQHDGTQRAPLLVRMPSGKRGHRSWSEYRLERRGHCA